eukprot:gene8771-18141_t
MLKVFYCFVYITLLTHNVAFSFLIYNSYHGICRPFRLHSTVIDSSKISSKISPTSLIFKGLEGSMFQHPVDSFATRQLSSLPFIQEAIRKLFQPIEDTLIVSNLSSAVLASPKQMPGLYNSVVKASEVLDMEVPELYIRQNPTPNAYTLAVLGRKPFIVLHTSLIDLLTPAELQAVIGHELGHLKCEHGLWVTALNILIQGVDIIGGDFGRLLAFPLQRLLLRWQRSAEFTCDRAALLVAQDVKVVASVMMKLCGGSTNFASEMDVDAFIQQAETFEQAQKSLSGRLVSFASDSVTTHPVPVLRVKELIRWENSAQYKGLQRRATISSAQQFRMNSVSFYYMTPSHQFGRCYTVKLFSFSLISRKSKKLIPSFSIKCAHSSLYAENPDFIVAFSCNITLFTLFIFSKLLSKDSW